MNVVRRRDQVEELHVAGSDATICTSDESIEERVQVLTQAKGVLFALDAVGGPTGSAVARSLGPRGRLLVYGTLSGEPLTLDPRTLIAGQKRVEGFWLGEWARAQNILTMLRLFRRIGRLFGAGVLTSEVGQTFPLDEVKAAVRAADTPGRQGKVLLRLAQP
jgi:NADPH:quinone reductase-like Zn-dependent oxidoreductase